MNLMMQILKDLTPLNRVFCSSDFDRSADYLMKLLPFKDIVYRQQEFNGWMIHPKWDVKKAEIRKGGEVLYDATAHPLRLMALSAPFKGTVPLDTLKAHLHYDHRRDDAVPFHFRQMYRPWDRDWGFCVTKKFFDSLAPGDYEIEIETDESEGYLRVLDYTHKGELPETFAIAAHLDHPGMANDDLAGCAVCVELFRRLSQRKTKFSYKLLILQEIIGSEYYWGFTNKDNSENVLEALFVDILGTDTQLALQGSAEGKSNFEKALISAMTSTGADFRTGPYKSICCNDEYIWECYGIPMAGLSRYPYAEYHTDHDSFELMSERALDESLAVLETAINNLENSKLVVKNFRGNICLSNPKYGLYVDPGQPAFGDKPSETTKRMRLLMDAIPGLHRPVTAAVLAERYGLSEEDVLGYLEKWAAKGLLEIR